MKSNPHRKKNNLLIFALITITVLLISNITYAKNATIDPTAASNTKANTPKSNPGLFPPNHFASKNLFSVSAQLAVCGNSMLEPNETCDDGNTNNGDGCSNTCLTESGWACTAPIAGEPSGTNVVADGSFEAGTPSIAWTPASTYGAIPGLPICNAANCGSNFANTGEWYVWMGGVDNVTSTVSQIVTIPATATNLSLASYIRSCADPNTTFELLIDNTQELLLDCQSGVDSDYMNQTVDISAYADGATHELLLRGIDPLANNFSNIHIDDIIIYDNVPIPPTPSMCSPAPSPTFTCNSTLEGFEDGLLPTGWITTTLAAPGSQWLISADNSSTNFTIPPAPEGSLYASANDDKIDPTSDGSIDYLYTNSIDLSNTFSASLGFQYFFTGAFSQAAGGIQVSANGGASWEPEIILPTNASWSSYALDLTSYSGSSDVRIRFHADDGGNDASGFAVDAISLTCSLSDIFVDDDFDSSTPGWNVTHFNSIQNGIDAAAASQNISIAEGTYDESVDLNKDITLHVLGDLILTGDLNLLQGTFNAPTGNMNVGGSFVRDTLNVFSANNGTIIFNGGTQQNLTLNTATTFSDLVVANGTTLVETVSGDNASVLGTLTNDGIIRKSQAIGSETAYTFGLIGGTMLVNDMGSGPGLLTSIQIDSIDENHPQATYAEVQTGRYWDVSANVGATGFSVDMTLPVTFIPETSGYDKLCRYTGEVSDPTPFDCGEEFENSGHIEYQTLTREDVTEFSTWTAGTNVSPTAVTLSSFTAAASPKELLLLFTLILPTALFTLYVWQKEQ
jgi:cysteine-rich repeat protein